MFERVDLSPDVVLYRGDCLEVMPMLDENSIDSIVTDPPYGLNFMGKDWDHGIPGEHFWREALRVAKPGAHLLAFGGTRTFHRLAVAIEDAGWEIRDTIMWVYSQGFPKGHDVAWEMHKLACITCGFMVEYDYDNEQATRIIPEAEHNLRFVRASYLQTPVYACAECGQVLQPFLSEQEAQELRAAWSKSEVIWPEQSSMEGRGNLEEASRKLQRCKVCKMSHGIFADGSEGWLHHGASSSNGSIHWQVASTDGSCPSYRPQSLEQLHRQLDAFCIERQAQEFRGWNTSLKPAFEPIIVARKPLEKGLTVAENVLEWGTGAINVDACRIGTDEAIPAHHGTNGANGHTMGARQEYVPGSSGTVFNTLGRWPSNLIHDGSDEVLEGFPVTTSGTILPHHVAHESENRAMSGKNYRRTGKTSIGDTGSAARFFYCAKASKRDRDEGCEGLEERLSMRYGEKAQGPLPQQTPSKPTLQRNIHPTVKPTALMRYICKLVTPPGGVILDMFMGSGSTGKAAILEGFKFIGIELDQAYFDISVKRISQALLQPRLEMPEAKQEPKQEELL